MGSRGSDWNFGRTPFLVEIIYNRSIIHNQNIMASKASQKFFQKHPEQHQTLMKAIQVAISTKYSSSGRSKIVNESLIRWSSSQSQYLPRLQNLSRRNKLEERH